MEDGFVSARGLNSRERALRRESVIAWSGRLLRRRKANRRPKELRNPGAEKPRAATAVSAICDPGRADLKRAMPAVMDGNDIIIAGRHRPGMGRNAHVFGIAMIEGGGIGKEVVPKGVRVGGAGARLEQRVAAYG